jgi:hypothetical protein
LVSLLWSGCGGGSGPIVSEKEHMQQQTGTEYFLEQAGFKKWQVTHTMPSYEALLSALPKRTIVTYERDGQKLHAYGDKDTRTLYIGDASAYQRYLALAEGRNLCKRRVGGEESAKFWSCMDEYRQGGGGQPEK